MGKTIDIKPTWMGAAPIIQLGLENGTDKGKALAREELKNMARAADAALSDRALLAEAHTLLRRIHAASTVVESLGGADLLRRLDEAAERS